MSQYQMDEKQLNQLATRLAEKGHLNMGDVETGFYSGSGVKDLLFTLLDELEKARTKIEHLEYKE